MRPGQNRRMRGRNRNNKGPNPLTRSYESNGPDVKIRGTAQHIAEKYSQLARDAQSSGDPVAAENYLQHAEHYFRIIAAAQEQLREQYGYQRSFDEDGDEEGGFAPGDRAYANGEDADFGSQPQPYEARPFEGRQDGRQEGRQDDDRGERPPRFDRGDRPDRGDRRERFGRDRQDRGPPRQDNRGERQENRQEGRQDFGREDRGERQDRGPRPDRGERNGRDFRRERREEPAPAAAAEEPGLPAFLTNPVRAPIATPIGMEPGAPEPALEGGVNGAANGEANGEFRLRRRRRRTRGFGDEAGADGQDFTPAVETPPAE